LSIERGLCTVSDVELYTRPAASYDDTTKPTKSEVEDIIDRAIDYIYARCEAEGIDTPVTETSTKRLIADLNAIYAAVLVEMVLHQSTHPNESQASRSLWELFNRRWEDLILRSRLDSDATNTYRKVVPIDTAIWTKMVDLWDSGNEDDEEREPWFKSADEW